MYLQHKGAKDRKTKDLTFLVVTFQLKLLFHIIIIFLTYTVHKYIVTYHEFKLVTIQLYVL